MTASKLKPHLYCKSSWQTYKLKAAWLYKSFVLKSTASTAIDNARVKMAPQEVNEMTHFKSHSDRCMKVFINQIDDNTTLDESFHLLVIVKVEGAFRGTLLELWWLPVLHTDC